MAVIEPVLFEVLVKDAVKKFTLSEGKTFGKFLCARSGVDVCFEQANRPAGSFAESRQ